MKNKLLSLFLVLTMLFVPICSYAVEDSKAQEKTPQEEQAANEVVLDVDKILASEEDQEALEGQTLQSGDKANEEKLEGNPEEPSMEDLERTFEENFGEDTDAAEEYAEDALPEIETKGDGGGGSGSGGNTGGGYQGIKGQKRGKVFVWFDRGGWKNDAHGGAMIAPEQGCFDIHTGWHNASNGKETVNFFVDLLDKKMKTQYGSKMHYPYDMLAAHPKWAIGKCHRELKQNMEDACRRAVARSNNPTTTSARVIGVAVTYCKFDEVTASGTWKNFWQIGNYKGDKTYAALFGGSSRRPYTNNDAGELPAAYGWEDEVIVSGSNGAHNGETWAQYAYRIGTVGVSQCTTTKLGYYMYVVAVADDQPPSAHIKLTMKKTISNTDVTNNNGLYSVQGTVFKIYETQQDAKNDTNAKETFTIGANGMSEEKDIPPNTYYLVETQHGPGLIIPNELKAANGGKEIELAIGEIEGIYDVDPGSEGEDGDDDPFEGSVIEETITLTSGELGDYGVEETFGDENYIAYHLPEGSYGIINQLDSPAQFTVYKTETQTNEFGVEERVLGEAGTVTLNANGNDVIYINADEYVVMPDGQVLEFNRFANVDDD